jgi:hypothetical protein
MQIPFDEQICCKIESLHVSDHGETGEDNAEHEHAIHQTLLFIGEETGGN